METGLTKNRILTELSRSPHGKFSEYVPIGTMAAKQEPEFMAHLIAWDRIKGQIRDSKVALPIVSLTVKDLHEEFVENALAHLALLGPRELLKAFRFAKELKVAGRMRSLRRLVEGYLRDREKNAPAFDRIAIQHRGVLKELYALAHIKPNDRADAILFKGIYPQNSIFQVVSQLKDMSVAEAAAAIVQRGIPFLIAMGALGKKAQDPDLVLTMIGRMSPTELVTNTKMLERLGMKNNPALRGAYQKAMEKASTSKANVMKTSRAAEEVEDETLKENLRGMQERQIQNLGGIEGNWLVLGDRSPSMVKSVEAAKHVAATLAKMVKGKVWLVFFDSHPQTLDVTGTAFDHIVKATRHISAGGSGTSIGCGLQRMLETKEEIDGIAIVTDGGENTSPYFADVYKKYSAFAGKEVPVYMYQYEGDSPNLIKSMEQAKIDMQVFDMRYGKVDYYSIPNLVQTMRTNRYSLVDEMMATRLLKLSNVLANVQGKEVQTLAS